MKRVILSICLLLSALVYGQEEGIINTTAKSWANAVTTFPKPHDIYGISYFIAREKNNGNWSFYDRFGVTALGIQNNAQVELVGRTSVTEVNSPNWTAYQGYLGNGSTSYVNTNFNPGAGGTLFTQNSASFGMYSLTQLVAGGNIDIGTDATKNSFINASNGTGAGSGMAVSVNDGTQANYSNSTTTGLFSTSRTASNARFGYAAGTQIGTDAQASTGINNFSFFICGANGGSGVIAPSNRRIAMWYGGSGSVNQANLYTDFQALATWLGFNK